MLGAFGPLTVVSQTPTQLVVTLPSGMQPGNYVLSVQVGKGAGNVDESTVTIGALDFWTNLSTDVNVRLGWSFACRVGDIGSTECLNDLSGGQFPILMDLEVYAAQ